VVGRLTLALALVLISAACQPAPVPPTQPTPGLTPAAATPTNPPATALPAAPLPSLTRAGPQPPPTPLPLQTPVPGGLDPRFGIAEGFRNPSVMADVGAGWERVVLSWADIQPDGPGDFSWLGRTLPSRSLADELNRGEHMAGLLQFTPTWAATNLDDPGRSVPRNLDLPDDDPNNYWGRFVYETVRYYSGRIDEWIIWNEPEFQTTDAAGQGSYTWLGTDAQFARLMEVAYRAAKRANPNATVAFPGTSYWVDQNSGRLQFYERFLKIEAANPDAPAENYFHDAVPLNLYRAPDDLVRIHQAFKDAQKRNGVDKPVWLLELNAMPTDDATIPCADMHAHDPIQTTQVQQAAYAVQALALAAAAGYERIGFYQMVDDNPCVQSAVWGITRDDGTQRPVAQSLRTAIQSFSGFSTARFAPLIRPQARWAAWPDDPSSFTPNWQVYEVAFDLPGGRRVTALWNGDGSALRVRIPRRATDAQVMTPQNDSQPATASGQDWLVDLPPATTHYPGDPTGYYFIGGEPRLLIEENVPANAPVTPPRLG
jgi:polysaccharide biosynthesis protein PslG